MSARAWRSCLLGMALSAAIYAVAGLALWQAIR